LPIQLVTFSLCLLVMFFSTPACARTPGEAMAAQDAGQTPAAPAPPAEVKPVAAELPAVVARVNGEAIDRGEFERAIRSIEARAGGPVPAEQRDAILRDVLEQLITYRLLTQESGKRQIVVADTEVESRIAQIRAQFPDDETFAQALSRQQMTVEALRTEAKAELTVAKMVEAEVVPQVTVGDKDVADFYQANPEEFKEPEQVRASHVLIRADQTSDEATKKKARAEAEQVLAKAKGGADFGALAREHSQDPGSAANGGDLEFFTRGQMVPAFEEAAFALEPDQMSGIVETPYGYHIIKVLERRAPRTIPLDEVRGQVHDFLVQRLRHEKTEAFIEQLKTRSKIEIFI
jgi:peptidyl-prolyl cis-trans isomerase C